MIKKPDNELIYIIQNRVLKWFETNGRSFPWRNNPDPYSVLLSEKLLQQTSVRQDLVEIFDLILQRYPTIQQLSLAEVYELRKIIYPLGLHYRAQEIIRLAKEVQERFDGNIPAERESLISIFGIGEYTARAVMCFAYGIDVPLVDTNIARIIYRLFGVHKPMPANPARKKEIIELAGFLVPQGRSKAFNWALIDLGSLVCTAKKTICESCPLSVFCISNKGNLEKK